MQIERAASRSAPRARGIARAAILLSLIVAFLTAAAALLLYGDRIRPTEVARLPEPTWRTLGAQGDKLGQFQQPRGITAFPDGSFVVVDRQARVQQFTPDLKPIRQIGRKGDLPGYFSQPKGLALDSQDHLYVVDANFEAVQIFDSNGVLLMDFGQEGRGPGELWLPAGIFIDARDRIWIADSYNRRVQVFDYVPERQP